MFKNIFLFIITVIILAGCKTTQDTPVPSPSPTPSASVPAPISDGSTPTVDCTYEPTVEVRSQGKINLPAKGMVVLESHYLTVEDGLKPSSSMKNNYEIQNHIDKSCSILKSKYGVTDCSKVYSSSYTKVWNGGPTSSGGDGGGAYTGVGGRYFMNGKLPLLADEMWLMNMRWIIYNTTPYTTSMPAWPTKYLAKLGNKAVVVSAGYEQGPPASEKWMFGMQTEPMYFLGAKNDSTIEVGKLKDQSIPYGPVNCK